LEDVDELGDSVGVPAELDLARGQPSPCRRPGDELGPSARGRADDHVRAPAIVGERPALAVECQRERAGRLAEVEAPNAATRQLGSYFVERDREPGDQVLGVCSLA
jgi:hypothetical protein